MPEQMSDKVWTILGAAVLGLMPGIVASVAYAADADLRLVQAPPPRREIDLGEIRPSDSPRCRQAKEDVKLLDGRLNGPEFADIPTQAEYNLGYGWEHPGAGVLLQSSGPTGRERTLETWGENSRQFREGEAANEKYKDFNRRAPRTFNKRDLTWTASHDFSSGDQFISAFPDLSPNRLADREIYDPQAP
jgi:hypothetical protein